MSCHCHGNVFVIGFGSESQPGVFYLTREEATRFAEALEREIIYRILEIGAFGMAGAAYTPITIADVALTQQEARRLLGELQVLLTQEGDPWANLRKEGF
jgi:hypothetical protein